MTYERFEEIWTTLVTNRVPAPGIDAQKPCLNNGVSEKTADVLVAVADGDRTELEEIERELSEFDKE